MKELEDDSHSQLQGNNNLEVKFCIQGPFQFLLFDAEILSTGITFNIVTLTYKEERKTYAKYDYIHNPGDQN